MASFVVEIVTPTRVVNQESVKYLRCPGIDGSFGVMKNHRNGVIAIHVGEIKVETKDDVEWYATSGGFVEILDNKVELLLESIERSNEIDVKRASDALGRANQRKKHTKEPVDNMRLEASLFRAVNRLKVSKKQF